MWEGKQQREECENRRNDGFEVDRGWDSWDSDRRLKPVLVVTMMVEDRKKRKQ